MEKKTETIWTIIWCIIDVVFIIALVTGGVYACSAINDKGGERKENLRIKEKETHERYEHYCNLFTYEQLSADPFLYRDNKTGIIHFVECCITFEVDRSIDSIVDEQHIREMEKIRKQDVVLEDVLRYNKICTECYESLYFYSIIDGGFDNSIDDAFIENDHEGDCATNEFSDIEITTLVKILSGD